MKNKGRVGTRIAGSTKGVSPVSPWHLQVVLAVAVAAAAAEADPQLAYANGLGYGHAYAGFAGYPAAYGAAPAYAGYAAPAYAAHAYAAAPVAAVAHAVPAPYVGTPVAHGLGLPEAATYVAPPVRAVAEAPIVEQVPSIKSPFVLFLTSHLQVVEPVEQWGYKVAY